MDEAKTMWKVGSYHENIVNLQGITVNVELDEISHVSNTFYANYPFCRLLLYNFFLVNIPNKTCHMIKVSLILEYCAAGNLRSYLGDHSKEFIAGISATRKDKGSIGDVSEPNKHTLELLILWSYQVYVK